MKDYEFNFRRPYRIIAILCSMLFFVSFTLNASPGIHPTNAKVATEIHIITPHLGYDFTDIQLAAILLDTYIVPETEKGHTCYLLPVTRSGHYRYLDGAYRALPFTFRS